MEFLPVQSLLDLCYLRSAYLLLFRNMEKTWFKQTWLVSLEIPSEFLSEVESLPKKVRLRIINRMKLVVGFLLPLLSSWFRNIPLENYLEMVTGDMLYECLVLKGDSMIDQRKTAAKLLRSRMFDNVFAFRLACMNFLETEVLKSWILVKEFFLNRIIFEVFSYSPRGPAILANEETYPHLSRLNDLPLHPCTTEPHEVLFWIGYCLSKEHGIDVMEVPHFAGENVSWYEFSLDSAAYHCNVACFDYFSNFHQPKIAYNNLDMTKRILFSFEISQRSCFIFHFMRLNIEEKADLVQRFPLQLVSNLLEYPLSLEFIKNYRSLWNLIPERYKVCTFLKIFAILFYKDNETSRRNMSIFFTYWNIYGFNFAYTINGIYSLDHLRTIWIKLWKISLDSYKLKLLNTVILKSIERSSNCRKFRYKFKLYGMEQKLRKLFISKGEAVLELYECINLKESLINLVSKYLKEDFEMLHRNCISFLANDKEQLVSAENPLGLEYKGIHLFPRYRHQTQISRIHENFFNYIKDILFLL